MPPKKKKGKKGKKGKGGEKTPEDPDAPPSDKEVLLQQELDGLTTQLAEVKKQVDDLRNENEWLQQEAHKIRVESHEYMSYMEKKTHKRQTTIVSLSDQNQHEITDIKHQKDKMLNEFDETKAALKSIMLEKENQMSRTKQELQDLQEYKRLQADQTAKIKDLERDVMKIRGSHSDAIQQLKSKFLDEKKEYQHDSDSKISAMAKQANKEALNCLNEHTMRIKLENRNLRTNLMKLIKKTRALHDHKRQLEEQKKELLREQQYAKDLNTLRSARQHKVLKAFNMLEEGIEDDISLASSPIGGSTVADSMTDKAA